MLKMIMCDYDFTLVDYPPSGEHRIQPEVLECLDYLVDKGLTVGIISGRTFDSLRSELSNSKIKFGCKFPNCLVCQDSYFYYHDSHGQFVEDFEINTNVKKSRYIFCRENLDTFQEILMKIENSGHIPIDWHIDARYGFEIVMENPMVSQSIYDILSDEYNVKFQLNRNHHLLNIIPNNEGKGISLMRIARKFSIEHKDILAIGDSLNDLSMLDGKYGFLCGTVSNADKQIIEAVKKADGYVATQRASLGVKQCIKHFINEAK